MRPLESLLPFEEARRRLLAHCLPFLRSEEVPLAEALGRAVAADVRAPIDVPPFSRSAMDGYAVRSADVASGSATVLRLVGAVHAGDPHPPKAGTGQCVQIASGAPLPEGADAVVMVEHTSQAGGSVTLDRPIRRGENVTPRGADIAVGSLALATGNVLTPARLAMLAALGMTKVRVYARPRVALLSTGSELRAPGTPLGPGQIYDSNSIALASLLAHEGIAADHAGIVPDDPVALRAALARFRDHDIVLATGSSSAGERDHLVEAAHASGHVVFHGVHVRPGKPLLVAQLGPSLLIGLAGNPASCVLMTYVFVLPALRQLQHLPLDAARRIRAPLARPVTSPRGKRHFLPVRLQEGRAEPAYRESDMTTSLHADGYVEIPDETESLPAGAEVEVFLF